MPDAKAERGLVFHGLDVGAALTFLSPDWRRVTRIAP